MNSREFEIYKVWRQNKYWRDLERLQNELASRGLASSSIRDKEEKWLKDEYDARVAREEAIMRDYESTKNGHVWDAKVQRYTNYGLVTATFLAAGAAIVTILLSAAANKAEYRPYVGVEKVHIDEKKVQISLINTGLVPANNLRINAKQKVGDDWVTIPGENVAFLMPLPQKAAFPFYFKEGFNQLNLESQPLEIQILYDGITSKNHETKFVTRFNAKEQSFVIMEGFAN